MTETGDDQLDELVRAVERLIQQNRELFEYLDQTDTYTETSVSIEVHDAAAVAESVEQSIDVDVDTDSDTS